MISKNIAEQAYCFLHQKWSVYSGRASETQRDDIEYAISSYVDMMDPELYSLLSRGEIGFLREHVTFAADMRSAIQFLDEMVSVSDIK